MRVFFFFIIGLLFACWVGVRVFCFFILLVYYMLACLLRGTDGSCFAFNASRVGVCLVD